MASEGLFRDVVYFLDASIPFQILDTLREDLDRGGAREYGSRGSKADSKGHRFPVGEVTHLITYTDNAPEISEDAAGEDAAGEENHHRKTVAVTPDWVKAAQKIDDLPLCSYYSPDPNMVFSGLVVTCTGLPVSDKEAIYGGVSALGGQWREVMTKEVTHLVAIVQEGHKYELAMSATGKALGIKVVLPHWFDDCFKLRALVPETQYAFPDPPLLSYQENGAYLDPNQSIAYITSNASGHSDQIATRAIRLVVDSTREKVPLLPSEARPLAEKTVYLASDLEIHAQLRRNLQIRIEEAGGAVIADYEPSAVNLYIGKYREGVDFRRAARKEKVKAGSVASLTWLYEVLTTGRWRSPKDCLLWWPVPTKTVPSFANHKISITNYTGLARDYLKTLIRLLGGEFTASMSSANTHLVAAAAGGEKYTRAPDWNIAVVNHLWLEDCYRHWCDRVVSEQRYNIFPQSINFTNLLGTKGQGLLDSVLDDWIRPDDLGEEGLEETVINAPVDVFKDGESEPPLAELPAAPTGAKPNLVRTVSVEVPSKAKSSSPRDVVARHAKPNSVTPLRPPAAQSDRTPGTGSSSRMLKELPVDNILDPGSRRRAADNAIEKVGLLVADANEFQKEKKRKSFTGELLRARKSFEIARVEKEKDENQENGTGDKSKRRREDTTDTLDVLPRRKSVKGSGVRSSTVEPEPAAAPRLLITGIDVDESRIKRLKALQFVILEKAERPTHLVANKIARTVKFLCAMATVKHIVTSDWLDACLNAGELVPEMPYRLQDDKAEFQALELSRSLARAAEISSRNQKLLADHQIYFTKGVKEATAVGHVVEFYGGTVLKSCPSWRSVVQEADKDALPKTWIISVKQDQSIWRALMEKAKSQAGARGAIQGELKIWTKDLVLRACLFQQWPPSEPECVLASESF